jgi:cytochrome P450
MPATKFRQPVNIECSELARLCPSVYNGEALLGPGYGGGMVSGPNAIHVPRPASDIDLWTEEALLEPYELWRELRDTAPAAYLRKYDVWALSRYKDVRDALDNWEVFSSAKGVTLNDRMNESLAGGTLCGDHPEHGVLRSVVRKPLAPQGA